MRMVFFRDPAIARRDGVMTSGQIYSLPMIVLGVAVLAYAMRKSRQHLGPLSEARRAH